MENINKLIAYLEAIAAFAKDIHYTCGGDAFYAKHLLADRIYDGLDGFIDQLKEVYFLGNNILPLPSVEYLAMAMNLLPAVEQDDKKNFTSMKNLIVNALAHMERMLQDKEATRGEVSLIDGIAQDLQGKLGLVNRQMKD